MTFNPLYLWPLVSIVVLYLRWTRSSTSNLPPGPPRAPFIGTLRLFLASKSILSDRVLRGELLHNWAKTYGDVMYLEVLGRKILILDSIRASKDLLDDKSLKYSDRPRVAVLDMIGWEKVLGMLPYGPDLHIERGMVQRFLSRQACAEFESVYAREALKLVRVLLEGPEEEHYTALKRYMISVTRRILYGHEPSDDHFMWLLEELSEVFYKADSFIADCFPRFIHDVLGVSCLFVRLFPCTAYGRAISRGTRVTKSILNQPLNLAGYYTETGVPSFVETFLSESNPDSAQPTEHYIQHVKNAAGMSFWGACDTVSGTLIAFVLAMVSNPDVQRKAQEEIDRVVGRERLPQLSDRPSLPYIEAILREALRWQPVAPFGAPHVSTEDDIYRGMFIPKGTIVIPNIKGMTLDETVHHEPYRFDPERFLSKADGGREEPFIQPYGFGRRICPGRFFADSSLWIAITMLLATCELRCAVNEDGEEMIPEIGFTQGVAVTLKPFPFSVSPRTANILELLDQVEK
ncbi:cytochrome P450 [Hymenopellis radicata]|nr:cytochrome P450 [Hymenopellis radicata]